jgi:hypothetical protein
MTWTRVDNTAYEYRDAKGVLWRAEKVLNGSWRLTADGQDEGLWMEFREMRLHVEGEIR